MHESIALFDEVVNARWFSKSAIILFMNKCDLFREKIKVIDMKCMFDDYTGLSFFLQRCNPAETPFSFSSLFLLLFFFVLFFFCLDAWPKFQCCPLDPLPFFCG